MDRDRDMMSTDTELARDDKDGILVILLEWGVVRVV